MRFFRLVAAARAVSSRGHFVRYLGVSAVYYNWLLFNMFPGLGGEKCMITPFIFNMFPGLGVFWA
jgi:hypothetical protein